MYYNHQVHRDFLITLYVFPVILAIHSDCFYIMRYHGLVMEKQYAYYEMETGVFLLQSDEIRFWIRGGSKFCRT
jgi:hypothetical protein